MVKSEGNQHLYYSNTFASAMSGEKNSRYSWWRIETGDQVCDLDTSKGKIPSQVSFSYYFCKMFLKSEIMTKKFPMWDKDR